MKMPLGFGITKNTGIKLAIGWLIIMFALALFFTHRTEISDNWQELPSITTKPWAIENVEDHQFKRLAFWDGSWYLRIAIEGYSYEPGVQSPVAFFPLYPFLIRLGLFVTNLPPALIGSLVSAASLIVACGFLFDLARRLFGDVVAKKTIWYMLLFPSAMFFLMTYTESLFLMLVVISFWAMHQKKWWLVGIAGFFLSLTRVIGVTMLLVALIEYWQQNRKLKPEALWLGLIPCGLLVFMVYTHFAFGDAWAFYHVQEAWHRPGWKNLIRVFDMPTLGAHLVNMTDAFATLLALVAGVLSYRFIRPSYAVYVLLGVIIPLSTGVLNSMLRYVLVLFPIFIMLALLGKRSFWFEKAYTLVMPMLLAMNLMYFIHFAWVG